MLFLRIKIRLLLIKRDDLQIKEIIADPIEIIEQYSEIPNPQIPLPNAIYMPQRKNSIGYDIENEITKLNIEKLFSSL